MDWFTGGKAGEMFVSLAFSGALVATISYLMADRYADAERRRWEQLGQGGFWAHVAGVLGIVATLFYLIYTHQYEYHYVWSHSSNELPVHFMISCFWEGQEGSFLLWSFWHCILGLLVMRSPTPWRNMIMGLLASVEMILTSMLLGVYTGETLTWGMYLVLALLPALYLGWRWYQARTSLPLGGAYHLGGVLLGASLLLMLVRGQMGVPFELIPDFSTLSLATAGFWVMALGSMGFLVLFGAYLRQAAIGKPYQVWEIVAGLLLFALAFVGTQFVPESWKLGSNPFILLKTVFLDDPVYVDDPNFIPTNGNGLNPLLQNYWMVIHPPTLFLGFASTTIPFCFVVAGLIKGQYHEWIRPAMPWVSFSVMILGVGIIMGGYWAYETLNFGGYWNWDPVENSSLVPWLCGVAALHSMLIYQKSKAYLRLTQLLIISTFLLVLYSTFLTRSGVLGDTSVHTFTDLGLSGQLIVLVAIYAGIVAVLMALRWRSIPQREDESKLWSPEFMLFLGVLIFSFSGLVILITTSLPVFNQIFGTDIAPPVNVQLFYYQWNVWFAILFGAVSGIGQFLWWKLGRAKSTGDALFRPFLLAVLTGSAILVALFWGQKHFNYDAEFASYLEKGPMGYVSFAFMALADEFLLYSALFGFFANADVLFSLIARNRKGLKVMGGTVVHIGFALMLLGILFSSGYDEIISKNIVPADLANFPEQEKIDNVRLYNGLEMPITGFSVQYIGRKTAQPPVSDLDVLEESPTHFKLSFRDKEGNRYATVQPRGPFLKQTDGVQPTSHTAESGEKVEGELDMALIERMMNEDLAGFEPKMVNNRTLYGLQFRSQADTARTFVVYPEAEMNADQTGIISHPGRKVFWNQDIYVYTSSLPDPRNLEPRYYDFSLRVGDTARIGNATLFLANVRNLSGRPEAQAYDVAAAAQVIAFSGRDTFGAMPMFVIKGNTPGMVADNIPELGLDIAFVGVQPEQNLIQLQARQVDPQADFVIIKAIRKPFINLLWLGTFILTAGFLISIYRRVQDMRTGRSREEG
ncbi:MAG: cytochrome c biogenesis protein CcsA [Bacteroidia bacterium]|nr:cytochrome c biogenesis protein CcsA [Bacteroidia bacterium]